VTKAELLAQSDFIVLCSPLTEDTFHQIGEAELHVVKPGAIVVNVSRGSEVDEEAVARALDEGRLAGYATDVFAMEDWPAAGRMSGVWWSKELSRRMGTKWTALLSRCAMAEFSRSAREASFACIVDNSRK